MKECVLYLLFFIVPKGYDNSTLGIDLGETLALRATQSIDRSFGDNYVQAAIFVDHTMYNKHNGDTAFLIRYHLAMMNMVSSVFSRISKRHFLTENAKGIASFPDMFVARKLFCADRILTWKPRQRSFNVWSGFFFSHFRFRSSTSPKTRCTQSALSSSHSRYSTNRK